jgi:C4-dicarboxylate transporter DctM subunit
MPWEVSAALILGILFLLLLLGVHVAFSLAFSGIVGALVLLGRPDLLSLLVSTAYDQLTTFELVAIPLFILMAEILLFSGIARDVYNAASHWLQAIPGGLGIASQAAAAIFAALTGSSTANTAVMGTIAGREMLGRGYGKWLIGGSLCAGGALGILIPPSIPMILYAILTQASIGKLFIAGIVPGLINAVINAGVIFAAAVWDPTVAPAAPRVSWGTRWRSLARIWQSLTLIAFILVALYLGIATPTEVAAVGAFFALLIALARRTLTLENLERALLQTVRTSGMIFLIIVGAVYFGNVLTLLEIPQHFTEVIVTAGLSPTLVIVGFMLILIVLGTFLEIVSILYITMPVIVPVMTQLGFDPIWFGVLFTINMEMALLTPPVGLNLYVMRGVLPEVPLPDLLRGAVVFTAAQGAVLVVVLLFPQLALWLPARMG